MKNTVVQSKPSGTVKPKGDRLHWTPLHEARPVTLSDALTHGKRLNDSDLSERSNKTQNNNLIP